MSSCTRYSSLLALGAICLLKFNVHGAQERQYYDGNQGAGNVTLNYLVEKEVDLKFQVRFPDDYEDPDTDDEYQEYWFANIYNRLESPDDGPGVVSEVHVAEIEPNKPYTFSYGCSETYQVGVPGQVPIDLDIKFFEIPGFDLYINGVRKNIIDDEADYTLHSSREIVLVPKMLGNYKINETINFALPLGQNPTRAEIGAITLKVQGVAVNQIDREELSMSDLALDPTFSSVTYNGGLYNVETNQYKIELRDSTNGFTATYYPRYYDPAWELRWRAFSANPVLEHKFENLSSNTHIRHTVRQNDGDSGSLVTVMVDDYYWNGTNAWDKVTQEGSLDEVTREVDDYVTTAYGGTRVEELTVYDASGTADTKRIVYDDFNNIEQIHKRVEFIGSTELISTLTYYEDLPSDEELEGNLKTVVTPEGSITRYEYYPFSDGYFGQVSRVWKMHENEEDGILEWTDFTEDWNGNKTLVSKFEKHYNHNGQWPGSSSNILERVEIDYEFSNWPGEYEYFGHPVLIAKKKTYISDTEYLLTRTASFRRDADPRLAGKPIYTVYPDGTMDLYVYKCGSTQGQTGPVNPWNSYEEDPTPGNGGNIAGAWSVSVYHGKYGYVSDPQYSVGISNDPNTGFYAWFGQSTGRRDVFDERGLLVREEDLVRTGWFGYFMPAFWKKHDFNKAGQIIKTWANNATDDSGSHVPVYQASFNAKGQVAWMEREDGTRHTLTYDDLGRTITETEESKTVTAGSIGLSGYTSDISVPGVVKSLAYDASGRLKETSISDGTEILLESREYYESGHLKDTVGIDGVGIRYTYSVPSGTTGFQVSETRIKTDGSLESATTTKTFFKDGSLQKIEGCGSCGNINKYYDYTVEDYLVGELVSLGDDTLTRFEKREWNSTGQLIYDGKSAYGTSGMFEVQYHYDTTTGELVKKQETGIADICYEFDDFGKLIREWQDLDGDGRADYNSDELIKLYETKYTFTNHTLGILDWKKSKVTVYTGDANGDASYDSKVISEKWEKVNDLPAGVRTLSYEIDEAGNTSWLRTRVQPGSNMTITEQDLPDVNDRPTASGFVSVDNASVSINGRQVAQILANGNEKLNFYDDLGRIYQKWDRTLGYQYTAYLDSSTLVDYVTAYDDNPGTNNKKISDFSYDSLNRVVEESSILDVATSNYKSVYKMYDASDRVTHIWGDTNPVKYEYDSTYGHLWKQSTFRGGHDWDEDDWDGVITGAADVTEFVVDARSGLVVEKISPDGASVLTTYTERGEKDVVTNDRGSSVDYDYDSQTGLLISEDQSDTTGVDVQYSYNRLGMVKQIVDHMGTRNFTFAMGANEKLVHKEEQLDATHYHGFDLVWDAYTSSLVTGQAYGKAKSVKVLNGSGVTVFENGYDYDVLGRLDTVDHGGGSYPTIYTYETNTSYISKRATHGVVEENRSRSDNTYLTQTVTGNFLDGGSTEIAKFHYLFDDGHRKIREFKQGAMFGEYGTYGLVRKYTYSDKGELTLAEDYLNNSATYSVSNGTTRTKGRYWSWGFDNQGNRSFGNGYRFGDYGNLLTSNYTTNENNQYEARTVPGFADLGGLDTAASDIEIWLNGTYSHGAVDQGDYFWSNVSVSNSSSSVIGLIEAKNGTTGSLVADDLFAIPQTPETMTYDSDGNLTSDGLWDYTYDAKNQLVSMESKTVVSQDGYFIIIDYVYDFMGRRAEKVVQRHEGSLVNLATVSTEKFIYNGWNVVAVIHDAGSPGGGTDIIGYTWGLDLSGTLDGAGGVGGLLAIEDDRTGGTYSVMQDGNGNISTVVDLTSKTVVAEFEYTPYGQTTREAGSYADLMPFRFSTKWVEENSDLYYYGFRFYDSENGRFIYSDPIEEAGGINVYAFVANDPMNALDLFGLNIYYLYDRDFLGGKAGHSATVIGGNGKPWQYRSKSPGEDFFDGSRGDNIRERSLPATWSFEKVMKFINKYVRKDKASAYDSAFGVITTENQDELALTWLDGDAPSEYSLVGKNCDDYVVGAFNAAGVKLKKGFTPSSTFKKALKDIKPTFQFGKLPGADYFTKRNIRRERISFTRAFWAMRDNMTYIDSLANRKLFSIRHPGWANTFNLIQPTTWVTRTSNGGLKIDQTEGMYDPGASNRLWAIQYMKKYYSMNHP